MKIKYAMALKCLDRGDVRQRKSQTKQALSWKLSFYPQRGQRILGPSKMVTLLPSDQINQIPHCAFPPEWVKRKTTKKSVAKPCTDTRSEPLLLCALLVQLERHGWMHNTATDASANLVETVVFHRQGKGISDLIRYLSLATPEELLPLN